MGALDSPAPEKKQKGKGLRRPKRRIGVRIDMTPMVDIAFLLLIFYMVTTVFAAPQAMEVNLPEDSDQEIKIPKSNLLILHVDEGDNYWWTWGDEGPVKFKTDSLRTLLYGANSLNTRLSTLIVINPEAKYEDFVNILDEIEVVEYQLRDNDEFMAKYREDNRDVLDSAATFSYRYSTKPWDARDDQKFKKLKSGTLLGGEGS